MSILKNRRPSPAMVVAVIALFVALAGTAYAAQTINGGAIMKQTIGAGKIKHKTLTGFQINTNKLGTVPSAQSAHHRRRERRRRQRRLPDQHQRLRQRRRAQQRRHHGSRRWNRSDQHLGRQSQCDRSPHPRRKRRQRRRRLPSDRRLPLADRPNRGSLGTPIVHKEPRDLATA